MDSSTAVPVETTVVSDIATMPVEPAAMPDIATMPVEPAAMPDIATMSVEPVAVPHIATLDELMASHDVVVSKEAADRETLRPLLNPAADYYRPQLFIWAAEGFPNVHIIRSFPFTPPSICSDGVTRDVDMYIRYLLGVEIEPLIAGIQAMLTGITASYSIDGGALRIHVTKSYN